MACWKEVKPHQAELGRPIDQCFVHFQSKPIAAGSVGQVYGATLLQGLKVAVKVLVYSGSRPR